MSERASKSVHPLQAAHKLQKEAASKRSTRIRKESKQDFLKSQDAGELCKELAELDDMEFNPAYGPAAVEHHTSEEWIRPGMMSERLASTAIKLKKERLNERLDKMEKMYIELKMQTTVDNIRHLRRQYQNSRNRKAAFKDAITMAKNVKMMDIIMPDQSLEMELSLKSKNIDAAGAVHVPQGGNRSAIEAATRARNRLKGAPGPPTLVLPRGFKRFKSGNMPPPPPPMKKKDKNDGPNYTSMAPGLDFDYDALNQATSTSFKPSGKKRAPPPPPRKNSDQPNTLSSKNSSNSITTSSKATTKYKSKSINAHEMTHFVPRGLVKKGNTDTVILKRNVKLPGVAPKSTGDKDTDEYNQFLYEVDSLPSKTKS